MLVWSLPLSLQTDFRSGMVGDGFHSQRRRSWIPGKERAERVLATATSIDGRPEWVCEFVWTRWRCRRCYDDIPAGLRGKAIAARTGRWSTGCSTSSGDEGGKSKSLESENKWIRARLEALPKGSKAFHPGERAAWRKSGERTCTLRMRSRAERSWMSKKEKLQKELREVEVLVCAKGGSAKRQ